MPNQINVTLRRPLGVDDPGYVARGWYTFADGIVTLTDENGVPLKRGGWALTARKSEKDVVLWSAPVPEGHDPRAIACRMLHQKVASEKSGSDFNRPLRYERSGIA